MSEGAGGRSAKDPVARTIASVALGLALVALVMAGYAVALGREYLDQAEQYREDVRTLGETFQRLREDAAPRDLPRLPLELDTGLDTGE